GLVEQVERDRRLDRRRDRLHVERGDVRTELVTDARHLLAHTGRGAGDDRVLAFVTENVVHWTETNYAVASPPPGCEGGARPGHRVHHGDDRQQRRRPTADRRHVRVRRSRRVPV